MRFKLFTVLTLLVFLSLKASAQCVDPFNLVQTGIACSKQSIQLNATDYPGAVYTWTGPVGSGVGGVMPSSITLNNLLLTTHNGTYTVTVQLPGGCIYFASINVSVETTPNKPVVTYKDKICSGEDNLLTGVTGGAPGVTYFWSGPDFIFSSPGNTVTLFNMQTPNAGTYQLYAQSIQGCISEVTTFDIFVYPVVIANFDFDLRPGCKEDTVIFKNLSTNNTDDDWSFGNGFTSIVNSPTYIYPAQGSYPVRLIVGNDNICFDTLDKMVIIDHFIKAGFTVDDDSVCQGALVSFTNTTTYQPAIIPLYEWDIKDGPKQNSADVAHLYNKYGEYDVTLIATDKIGCKDTFRHIVVVDSAGSIGLDASHNEICLGRSLELSGSYLDFQQLGNTWNMGDGNILFDKPGLVYSFDKPGTYPVKFSVDYRICPDLEISKEILVKDVPKINLGEDQTICPNGKPITLKDEINADDPNAKWSWNDKSKTKASSIIVRSEGTYAATVEINGCSETDTVVVRNNCYINIPNTFSPNGDGSGDYFLPREFLSRGVKDFSMQIFNRWGEPVFATTNAVGRGWDGSLNGKPQPLGVYVYLIKVGFVDGSQENYNGNVTLLR